MTEAGRPYAGPEIGLAKNSLRERVVIAGGRHQLRYEATLDAVSNRRSCKIVEDCNESSHLRPLLI